MNSKPFRVLSLDGGGIRGLYTASLLEQLGLRLARFHCNSTEQRLDIGGQFDLIVGTSTGSILAIALAAGASLEEVLELYRSKAKRIFQLPMPLQKECFQDQLRALFWAIRNMFSPANKSCALREALTELLQNETLEELYNRREIALCIPSIDAETQRAWVFKTPHAKRLTRDNHYKLVDVCMASAAAPIYFPLHVIDSPNGSTKVAHKFVDGGLWANNPVMVGLVEALELTEDEQPIEILSIGTCGAVGSQTLTRQAASRGTFGWKGGVDISSMSMEAQAFATPYLAKQIAKAIKRVNLYRLQDPTVSAAEAQHLALDAVDDKSLMVLETLGQRATDLNYSVLTNSASSTPAIEMVLRMFSDVGQLKEKE